jgi:undecaprenyl-diphosphatase
VLERIIDFLRPYLDAPWGYVLVGVAVFLENSVGAGLVVPGETLVILGGFYARVGDLWLPLVMFIVVVCAIAGDNVGYLIGRRYGRRFLDRHGKKLFVTPARVEVAERYYEEHGGKTVFLGRFVPVVRSVGFIVAGAAHMEWRRFIVYDVAGAAIWGIGHTLLGYFLGASYERWEKYLTPVGLGILVILLVTIGGSKLLAGRRKVKEELEEIEQELEHEPSLEPGTGLEPGAGQGEDQG